MELVPLLRKMWGNQNVIATDVKSPPRWFQQSGPFHYLDVVDKDQMARIALENGITTIVHMASMLSATGEKYPQLALKVNNEGIQNVLELARINELRVFAPSTIAVFGPTTPKDNTPDETIMRPTTMYGLTKVFGENLGEYYHRKFGVDFRSLRYPGVISSETLPGGGTTDYAVEIYYDALESGAHRCFLSKDTVLPMMYMPDLLRATVEMITAPSERLSQRVYNLGAMSFTPEELTASIAAQIPGFETTYEPDFRQDIANTWPRKLDDSRARADWGWQPEFDIDTMTVDMLEKLSTRLECVYHKPEPLECF